MFRSLVFLVLLWALPTSVGAYVCSQVDNDGGTATGPSLSWFKRDLDYALHAYGTADVPDNDELQTLRESFLPWCRRVYTPSGTLEDDQPIESTLQCIADDNCRTTDLTFREANTLSTVDAVGYDFLHPEANENLLIFRDDGWPIPGQTAGVIGLTTTSYNALTGEILDADIEFNSATFHFTITNQVQSGNVDLMNTAVHEIGHFLGLGHSEVPQATMAPTAGDAEISKRDLHEDDRNAIVFKYPAGEANGYCEVGATNCSCMPPETLTAIPTVTAAGHNDGNSQGCRALNLKGMGASLLLLGWLVAAASRRRRRG